MNQDANSIFKEDGRIKECNLVKYCRIFKKSCVVMEDGRRWGRWKGESKEEEGEENIF